MTYKIGAVGPRSSVLGFMALGFGVFEADNAETASECIDKMAHNGYAVIFITQSLCAQIKETIEKYSSSPVPSIVPIPDDSGTDYGEEILKDAVVRAIGADILYKD
ncbi:MAG: V-type ATP synthase subunit F [Clostridia bacterium]|nr:V-type ATP synthase subunit F [Clostridia bacterium]